MAAPDFHAMSDDELEKFIRSFPDRYDLPGALFEHQQRQALWTDKIEMQRHWKTQRVAWIAVVISLVGVVFAVLQYLDSKQTPTRLATDAVNIQPTNSNAMPQLPAHKP